PGQLAIADLDGVHECGSALEQAISEAAGGGATVERHAPCHGHAEVIERGLQLVAAPTDVAMPPAHTQRGITRYEGARLINAPAVDQHLAGHDPAPRFILGSEDSALDQQGGQRTTARASFGHGAYASRIARGRGRG